MAEPSQIGPGEYEAEEIWTYELGVAERRAARVVRPEGASYSGGVLEYTRRTQQVQLHPVADVVTNIARVEGALFLGTTHGVYVLRGHTRRRFRMEPDINGRMIVVAETVR